MNKKTFNLKSYIKKAFYEDGRGYMNAQTRSWQNCYKAKSDAGKNPQEAWTNCMEEFQTASDKGKWLIDYGADKDTGAKPYNDAKTPAAKKIVKK